MADNDSVYHLTHHAIQNTGHCPDRHGTRTIWQSLSQALKSRNPLHQTVIVAGQGCPTVLYQQAGGYLVLVAPDHIIPVATGVLMANPSLQVVAVLNDAEVYHQAGHLAVAIQQRLPLTVLVCNQHARGGLLASELPGGAAAQDESRRALPNPLMIGLDAGCTLVARSFAADTVHLTQILTTAIEHRGCSLIDVLQPCSTPDHDHTYAWYRQHLRQLPTTHNALHDRRKAWLLAQEWGEYIPLGVLYQQRVIRKEQPPARIINTEQPPDLKELLDL